MTFAIVQNDPGAEEANSGEDALNDPTYGIRIHRGQGTVRRTERDHGGDGSAETNESMRAQAGGFAVELAIQAEGAANEEGCAEAERDLSITALHSSV